jgi:TolA-binding protein
MLNFLDKIPEKAYLILAYGLGVGITLICAAAGAIIVRASSFTYSDKDTQINLNSDRVKKISNDTEYANAQLQEKLADLESEIDQLQGESAKPIQQAYQRLKPVAKEIDKSNENLKEAISDVE